MAKKRAKPARKRVAKTAVKTAATAEPAKVEQPHGGALLPGGVPGNKGGSGRPPAEFKEWCRALLDDEANREQVVEILGNKNHPAYATMWKAIADRAHGKPKQSVEVESGASLSALLAKAFAGKGA